MADSPENVTLLKLRADASQLKEESAAARQAVVADMQAMQQAATTANTSAVDSQAAMLGLGGASKPGGSGRGPGGLVDAQQQMLGLTAASDKLNDSINKGERGREAFTSALTLMNPQMGLFARMALQARDALALLMSPVGLFATIAAAAVAAATAAIRGFMDETKRAREEWEKFQESQRAAKEKQTAIQEGAADRIAKAGITSDQAVDKARAIRNRLAAKGFKEEAIDQSLSYLVNPDGSQAMSDADMEAMVAIQEFDPTLSDSANKRERSTSLRAMRSKLRKPQAQAFREAVENRHRREQERLKSGDVDAIRRELASEGVPESDMDQAAQDILDVVAKGQVEHKWDWFGSRQGEALRDQNRQQEAVRRAGSMRMLSPAEVADRGDRDQALARIKRRQSESAQGIMNVNNFHGPVYLPSGYGTPKHPVRQSGF